MGKFKYLQTHGYLNTASNGQAVGYLIHWQAIGYVSTGKQWVSDGLGIGLT